MIQVGNDEAICVHYVNIIREDGVVTLQEGQLFCVTCKYGRHHCYHVASVKEYLAENKHDFIPLLQTWMHVLQLSGEAPFSTHTPGEQKCMSSRKISFSCTFLHSTIMKMPSVNRFNMSGGLCHLKPTEMDLCPICGSNATGSDIPLLDIVYIITSLEILEGKGMCWYHGYCNHYMLYLNL